jgi:hypothetical protein
VAGPPFVREQTWVAHLLRFLQRVGIPGCWLQERPTLSQKGAEGMGQPTLMQEMQEVQSLLCVVPRDILNNVTKINRNQEDRSAPGKC